MKYLLAPHNDDEALFATYTLLRHQPTVVVCLDGWRGRRWDVPVDVRAAETAAALAVLGCPPHIQLSLPPDWGTLADALEIVLADAEHVWAPLPEEDGHSHHNRVGELAMQMFPGRCTLYATYTMTGGKTTVGRLVPYEDGWPELKRAALSCYASQLARPGTRPHFERSLDEYQLEAP